MTKKSGKKKRTSKKSSIQKTQLKKVVSGLLFLIVLVVLAGFLAHQLVLRRSLIQSLEPSVKSLAGKKKVHTLPIYEIYPEKEIHYKKSTTKPKPTLTKKLPKVAIIIDDIGYDRKIAEKFLNLDAVLTFSLLPHSLFQDKIARKVHAKGFETMLHLPLEPLEYPLIDPGPGTLLTSMSPDELIIQLNKNIDAIPFIKGVNNHMGSKMTTSSTQIYQIFSILKKRNLFFIDSRTTSKSLCKPSARLLQLPFAQRDVFIDHIREPDFIRKQINLLISIADKHGEAIGIAHPHIITYKILRELLPELQKKVQLVPASQIVHIPS
ncbi:MAG: divergent polysaccharide deacetylase family protein [Desulfobacteraceae bacterium]|nr:divergent polysaccharide deacetylase family protein [Desulfobacteraceae bacterium]MBC2719269.1 divergent polysaccharide deacetylase family protein [Desulfobacteraceae bacterium]